MERPLIAPMRWILIVGGGFVLVAGVQLFVLTERTDEFFAWTIASPLTASFLGAFYLSAAVLAFLSAREPTWAAARLGVPGVLAFVWLTLLATLLHLDPFHLEGGDALARGAAWVWLAIYVLEPPVLLWAFVAQLRTPRGDPARTAPLPPWFRGVMGVQAAIALAAGAALFVSPEGAGEAWPWTLTPLTARAIASWLFALGGLLVAVAWENHWPRVRYGMALLLTLTPLQAVALVRYSDELDWGSASTVVYLLVAASLFAAAVYGGARSFGPVVSRRKAPSRAARYT